MKNLLTSLILLFACAIVTNAQKDTVTVISYNIRYNNPDDGENIWENRRDNAVIMVNME